MKTCPRWEPAGERHATGVTTEPEPPLSPETDWHGPSRLTALDNFSSSDRGAHRYAQFGNHGFTVTGGRNSKEVFRQPPDQGKILVLMAIETVSAGGAVRGEVAARPSCRAGSRRFAERPPSGCSDGQPRNSPCGSAGSAGFQSSW